MHTLNRFVGKSSISLQGEIFLTLTVTRDVFEKNVAWMAAYAVPNSDTLFSINGPVTDEPIPTPQALTDAGF